MPDQSEDKKQCHQRILHRRARVRNNILEWSLVDGNSKSIDGNLIFLIDPFELSERGVSTVSWKYDKDETVQQTYIDVQLNYLRFN